MKKTLKKAFAALVALVMLFAMGTMTAMADESYTITVTNTSSSVSIVGNEYSAYKIFDVTYNDNKTAYSYTADADFVGFTYTVDGTTYQMSSTAEVQKMLEYLESIESNSAALNTFATAVYSYITEQGINADAKATATDESVTLDVTDAGAGYYLVYGTSTANDGGSTVVSAIMLDTTDPNAEINLKADAPTIDKQVKDADDETEDYGDYTSVNVGDEVSFKITSSIPSVTGYTTYTYIIHDTMSDGLTYDADKANLTVKVGDTPLTADTDYELKVVNNADGTTSITIEFKNFIDLAAAHQGEDIVVTYNATLDKDAYDEESFESNSVYLQYSNSPYTDSTGTTTTKTVYVADFDIEVLKYYVATDEDGTETNTTLAGAKFALYKEVNGAKYYYKVVTDADTGEVTVTWVTDETEATIVETDADGFAQFAGLEDGTYYLQETEAPDGYNLREDPFEVVITLNSVSDDDQDGAVTVNATVTVDGEDYNFGHTVQKVIENYDPANDNDTNTESNPVDVLIPVLNTTGTELPSTGGIGTYIFYAVGIIMMAAAGYMFLMKKRNAAFAEEA